MRSAGMARSSLRFIIVSPTCRPACDPFVAALPPTEEISSSRNLLARSCKCITILQRNRSCSPCRRRALARTFASRGGHGRSSKAFWTSGSRQPAKARLDARQLAEAADISSDMVAKIETGASGARFPVIERLAAALDVDPAELFTSELPSGLIRRGAFLDISTRLAGLSGPDLVWMSGIVEAALAPKIGEPHGSGQLARPASTTRRAKRTT